MTATIYPKISFDTIDGRTTAITQIRLKAEDDKWYLAPVRVDIENTGEGSLFELFNQVNAVSFKFMSFGVVNSNLKDSFGGPVFRLDENQQTEEERLHVKF